MLRKVAGCPPGNIVSLFGNDKNVKSLKYGIFFMKIRYLLWLLWAFNLTSFTTPAATAVCSYLSPVACNKDIK